MKNFLLKTRTHVINSSFSYSTQSLHMSSSYKSPSTYSSRSISSMNSISNSFVKSNFTLQTTTKSNGFKQPTRRSNGQFLWKKINLSKLLVWSQHLLSALRTLSMEKILPNSIWLIGIPKIYLTSAATIGNFCSFVRYHVKAHEQVYASTWYQWNEPSFQHTISL